MSRYSPMGRQTDEIFAEVDSKAAKRFKARQEEKERSELSDIKALCKSASFRRWFKRTFDLHGGMFNNGLKTDAGQAHGMTIYSMCADLSRAEEGKDFVSEIVSEHFMKLNKGENK